MDIEKIMAGVGVVLTALPAIRAVLESVIPHLEKAAAKTEAKWDDDGVSKLRYVAAVLDGIVLILPKLKLGKRGV